MLIEHCEMPEDRGSGQFRESEDVEMVGFTNSQIQAITTVVRGIMDEALSSSHAPQGANGSSGGQHSSEPTYLIAQARGVEPSHSRTSSYRGGPGRRWCTIHPGLIYLVLIPRLGDPLALGRMPAGDVVRGLGLSPSVQPKDLDDQDNQRQQIIRGKENNTFASLIPW